MTSDEAFRPLRDDGGLHADLPCRRCGYLLRGLRLQGKCPECGLPVFSSYQGDYLKFSDPRWLARLRTATWIIFVVAVLTDIAIPLDLIITRQRFGLRVVSFWIPVLFAIQLFAFAGTWLLTIREPVRYTHQNLLLPRLTRWVRIVEVACWTAVWFIPQTRLVQLPVSAIIAFRVIGFGGWIAAQILEVAVLRRLLLRIPNHTLARWADVLIHGLSILMGICYGILLLEAVFPLNGDLDLISLVYALNCALFIVGSAAIGFQLLALPFLIRTARALAREQRRAFAPANVPAD